MSKVKMERISMLIGSVELLCDLRETPTAHAIWEALPITGRAMTWGDEVYFQTPVDIARESDARELMQAGEIAYWPEGNAVAIGFGETPISAPGEIRLAAPCNVWADAVGDVALLRAVRAGDKIEIRRRVAE